MALFNGLARIQVHSQLASGQACLNSFYIAQTGAGAPPSLADLGSLLTEIHTWLGTQYRAVLTTADTLVEYKAFQVPDPTNPSPPLEAVQPENLAGTRTVASDPSPQSLCSILSWKTPNASRRFRGHIFLPPAKDASALINDGYKGSQAYWVAVVALQAKFQAGCGPTVSWTGSHLANYFLSVYSPTSAHASAPSVATVQTVAVNSARANWLRSRERGQS